MRKLLITGLAYILLSGGLYGQDDNNPVSFSLTEAVDFALKNNNNIKNADLDILSAKKEVWATTAIGLPQVNGSYDYQHLPGTLPSLSFPNPDGGFQQITLGVRNSATYNVRVSQLVFSGEYIVGLQAARTFLELSANSKEKSEADVKESVHMAYFTVLVLEKNKETLDSSVINFNSVLADTKKMYEQGFMDEMDYEQLLVTKNSLVNSVRAIERQIQISKMLFRIQLGLGQDDEVILTDNLDGLLATVTAEKVLLAEFDLQRNLEYRLLNTQERISELTLNREKTKYLPSVSAFYLYQDKTRKADFDVTFNNILGLNISVPIFSSGMRNARVGQARIELEKIRNTKEQVSETLIMAAEQARMDFSNAYEKFLTEKENVLLARKVFERTEFKYKQGVSSSMDLSQANNQYLDSYSAYTSSMMEFLSAKIKFEKALNNL
jgi:outer membrane protein